MTGNVFTGLHEFQDMSFLLHYLREEDLFVDVGANAGSYSILAGSAAGARVFAYEPVPEAFGRLVENMRLNRVEGKVTCVNKAVGANCGSVMITTDNDTMNHPLAHGEQNESGVQIELTTLDHDLREEHPALVKIDVEGYEAEVIKGARETLVKESLHAVIVELNGSGTRYGWEDAHVVEMIRDYGFVSCAYDAFSRDLTPIAGKNAAANNTLFIRDERHVLERIRSAPKVQFRGESF